MTTTESAVNQPGSHPENSGTTNEASAADAQRGFSKSIMISGIRCMLTYVVLPFVAPLLGFAPGIGPVIGIVVGVVAIAANAFSIRRFWSANHKWKKPITVIHIAVIALMLVLIGFDIQELVT